MILDKTDAIQGRKVEAHLRELGIDTPVILEKVSVSPEEKIAKIKPHVTEILTLLGLDLSDDSLMETPDRVAKMYVAELFSGLDYHNFPKCTAIENKMQYGNSFVLEKGINLQSSCEHHLVTISSYATIAYIPKRKVLGLSKLNRIADFFGKRPQVQERLTKQICETISFITESDDVAVYIDGVHYCVKARGIRDQSSSTVTLAAKGVFETDPEIRREFLAIARSQPKP